MATRSPTQTHAYWGVFPTINLPASANVEVGDTAFDSTLGTLVVCTAVGPVVWTAVGGGGGTIAGTIAANEVAFGTGVDSIGGSAQLEWNPGTGILTVSDPAVTPVLTVDTTSAVVDLAVNELRLAGNAGAAGEVLTSNGPGVAPLWIVPDVPAPLNGQHSNPSPIDVGAFYFTASRTVGISSSALVEMSGGVGLWQAQIQLVNLSGTVVATFDTGIQGFAGYYSATLTPLTPVAIPAGWYRVTLANISSGTATALGLFLSAV